MKFYERKHLEDNFVKKLPELIIIGYVQLMNTENLSRLSQIYEYTQSNVNFIQVSMILFS